MVVVADTTPVNYLILIGKIDLLNQLYKRILVPPAVLAELKHPFAPKPVHDWAVNAPAWVEVVNPKIRLIAVQLDSGESEAIALAAGVHAGERKRLGHDARLDKGNGYFLFLWR